MKNRAQHLLLHFCIFASLCEVLAGEFYFEERWVPSVSYGQYHVGWYKIDNTDPYWGDYGGGDVFANSDEGVKLWGFVRLVNQLWELPHNQSSYSNKTDFVEALFKDQDGWQGHDASHYAFSQDGLYDFWLMSEVYTHPFYLNYVSTNTKLFQPEGTFHFYPIAYDYAEPWLSIFEQNKQAIVTWWVDQEFMYGDNYELGDPSNLEIGPGDYRMDVGESRHGISSVPIFGHEYVLYRYGEPIEPLSPCAFRFKQAFDHQPSQCAVAGDVDNDGDADLIIGNKNNWGSYSYMSGKSAPPDRLFLNDGNGNFSLKTSQMPSDVLDTRGLALGDVDGDGDQDLVRAVYTSWPPNYTKVFLNDGHGNFLTEGHSFGYFSATDFKLVDLDGDEDLDAVMTRDDDAFYQRPDGSGYTSGDIRFWLNDGSGVFTATNLIPTLYQDDGWHWRCVECDDLNGDGLNDLVVGAPEGMRVYTNSSSGLFCQMYEGLLGEDIQNLIIDDIDGDGLKDIYVGIKLWPNYYTRASNKIFINTPSGFVPGLTNVLNDSSTYGIGLVDVENDGDLDVIENPWLYDYANRPDYAAKHSVYLNSNGVFSAVDGLGFSNPPMEGEQYIVEDFNGDGFDDVFCLGRMTIGSDGYLFRSRVYLNVPEMVEFVVPSFQDLETSSASEVILIRRNAKPYELSCQVVTEPITAQAGVDFEPFNQVVTFASNEVSKTISIPLINDAEAEGNESFRVSLYNPERGSILGAFSNATVVIEDDESFFEFSASKYVVTEENPCAVVTVMRQGGLQTTGSVSVVVSDGSASSGLDYALTNAVLLFEPGVQYQALTIPLFNDTDAEADETIKLMFSGLSSPSNATVTAEVTILDDDRSRYVKQLFWADGAKIMMSRPDGSDKVILKHFDRPLRWLTGTDSGEWQGWVTDGNVICVTNFALTSGWAVQFPYEVERLDLHPNGATAYVTANKSLYEIYPNGWIRNWGLPYEAIEYRQAGYNVVSNRLFYTNNNGTWAGWSTIYEKDTPSSERVAKKAIADRTEFSFSADGKAIFWTSGNINHVGTHDSLLKAPAPSMGTVTALVAYAFETSTSPVHNMDYPVTSFDGKSLYYLYGYNGTNVIREIHPEGGVSIDLMDYDWDYKGMAVGFVKNPILSVRSKRGTPLPPVGNYQIEGGTNILFSLSGGGFESNGVQVISSGWSGTGGIPTSGATTNFGPVLLMQDSTVTWNWTTNYWLQKSIDGPGALSVSNGWKAADTNLSIQGAPAQYYRLAGWNGDLSGADNPQALLMDGPKSIGAVFVEIVTTNLNIPHWWLADQGFDIETTDPEIVTATDHDHDGYTTGQEYVLGTSPMNKLSRLELSISSSALEFTTSTGRLYSIESTTNLISKHWNSLTNNIPGSGNFISLPLNSTESNAFFRIEVSLP